MKIVFSIIALLVSCVMVAEGQISIPSNRPTGTNDSTTYALVGVDGNQDMWQKTDSVTNTLGKVVRHVKKYNEIATGLNYLKNGRWVASKENIVILPDGTAAATNGQHQAYFPADIYSGTINLTMPDGQRLQSRPLGLSYDDGNNVVMIAILTNSIGQLMANNQTIYTNAFNGINADVLYIYKKGGFEQDIILRQQPPTPESLGLNPITTKLQVLTEFFDPPQPRVKTNSLSTSGGRSIADEALDFGAMKMAPGRTFLVGAKTAANITRVGKRWVNLEGRMILMEEVPMGALSDSLSSLPQSVRPTINTVEFKLSKRLQLPSQRLAEPSQKGSSMQIAQVANNAPGLVLDYNAIISGVNDYTFRGDTTYYISDYCALNGTTTIEGGAVIKYPPITAANSANYIGMTLMGSLNCQTSPYRPAIFTSMNDDSVGEIIPGSTGNPTVVDPQYGWDTSAAIWYNAQYYDSSSSGYSGREFLAHDLQIRYMVDGIMILIWGEHIFTNEVWDCQFNHTDRAIIQYAGMTNHIYVRNVLINDSSLAFQAYPYQVFHVEQATIHKVYGVFWSQDATASLFITNSLLIGVTNIDDDQVSSYNCITNINDAGIFQTIGAGMHYLATNSPYRGAGTTNINSVLLTELRERTTYPPVLYSNTVFSTSTVLGPQVQTDTNLNPDLGYHYYPVDYIVSSSSVSNATLVVTNGAIVASYGQYGLQLINTGRLVSVGSPLAPNLFLRSSSFQEEPYQGTNGILADATSTASALFQFTKFTVPANSGYDLYHGGGSVYGNLDIENCEFYGGGNDFSGSTNTTIVVVKNNLFWRSSLNASNTSVNASLFLTNNTFWGTSVTLQMPTNGLWSAYNNAFDSCTVSGTITNGFNAYLAGSGWLDPTNSTDYFSTSGTIYQSGALGNYYLPTNSPLINVGSTTADQEGLYQFTTQTNQVKEANSTVDVGYHYVATDAYGNPVDSNGDSIPDYIEDANDNGLNDVGETSWSLAITAQPADQTIVQGGTATFNVTAAGVVPLGYQWFFNTTNIVTGATNATLTISNAQTNSAGSYSVMVTNNGGALTSSNAILTFFVPPTISITNPATGSAYMAGSNVSVGATATVVNSSITQVQFFRGTNSLGIDTNAPYGLIWSNAPAGNYVLTAVATANNGLTATSSIVNIFFSPLLSSTNLAIWLKADAITGLTNAAEIATWLDASGRNNHATQTNSLNRPSWIANALNGQPVVRFNGSNSFLRLPNFLSGTTAGEEFVVLKVGTNLPSGLKTLWTLGSGSGLVSYPNTNGQIVEGFGSTVDRNVGVPASPLTEYHLYEVAGKSGSWMAWINGQLQASLTGNTYGIVNDLQTLGVDTWYATHSFYGDVAEVLIFNRTLTTDERVTVNTYLNGKYGLVPPVSSAPTNLMAQAVSTTQIGLTWNQSFNHGVTRVSLERKTGSGGTYQEITQLTDATSYMDTNLTAGTTYYYRARSANLTTWSDYSNETNATTLATGSDVPFTNLLVWLKADTGLEQAGTNTPVNFWGDQSGRNNHATQTNSLNRPSWIANALNGQPVVRFNGSNSFLRLPNFLSGTTAGEEFVVLKVGTNLPSGLKTLWTLGSGSGLVSYPNTNGQIVEGFGSTVDRNVGVPASPLTEYHLYEVAGKSGSWMAWINGQLQASLTGNTYGIVNDLQTLGVDTWYATHSFYGDVAEVLIFNRTLTTDERVTVNTYLNGKYGLVPPVSSAPTNLMAQAVSTTQIGLTWNQSFNHGVTRVSLERKTGSGGTYQEITQLTDATSYMDTNLTAGTTYYYRARSANLTTWSDYSNETNATTLATGSDVPFTNLLVWLKADTGLEQAGTNTPVNFWGDQSGRNNHATQTNSLNRPSWIANALNGQPVVRFNGSNSFLRLPNFLSGTTAGEEFVVLKVGTNLPSGLKTLWTLGSGSGLVSYPNTNGQIVEGFGSTVDRNVGVPASPLTEYHLYEVAGKSGSWMAWINGQLQASLTGNTYGIVNDLQTLGVDTWYATHSFYGDVAEVLIFNRTLTTDERVTVNTYLNGKYGLVPPVSSAPTNLMAQAVSTTQIGLTWNQSFNHGVTRVSLERKTGSGGTYQEITQLTDATSYMDTNLTAGTTYYYRARSANLTTWSDYSNETNATTLATGSDVPFTNLLVWLKADTGLEQAGTNTPVNFWGDQSGRNNHATQTNSLNRPSWIANALNGQPVVRFNGSNSFLRLPNFLSGTTAGEEFVVLKVGTNLPSGQKTLWQLGSGSSGASYPNTSGQIVEGFGSAVDRNVGVPASPLTQYHVYEVAGQNNSWMAWFNSQLQTNITSNTYWFINDVQTLGADLWNTTHSFYGDVAEVLIFNRTLTTDERVTVNTYLNGKYGLVPVVSITTPTNNSLFATGSSIGLTASVFESAGGTIKKVEYFQGTNSVGFSTTAPYSVTWNNVAAGSMTSNTFALTARVTGDNGLMSTSSIVNIQVEPAPSVSITSPSNNAYLGVAPASLTVSATATGIVGISQVQFFQGTNSLGIVTNPPYYLTWNSVPAASYSLRAVATGNDTLTNTSAAVNIIVDIDSDNDGLGELQEKLYGTNPYVSDGFWIWISAPNGTF